MLKCATSLWSADLANLQSEMKRVEPFSDRFHIDVADGHYVRTLLFFPDLVRTLRGLTALPLEVHLMTDDPRAWADEFIQAGADTIIFCLDSSPDPLETLQHIHGQGKKAGVSLLISEDLPLLEGLWEELDILTIVGTAMGIKGAGMDPGVPEKIQRARKEIQRRGVSVEIQCDGGIRRETTPLLHAAGADSIVPGSLMFKEDPREMTAWLASL